MTWLFLGGLIFFMLLGVPVAYALGITVLTILGTERGWTNIPFGMVAQRMLYGVDSFPLLAIPLFLLAGRIMNEGGVTNRIFHFANTMVGHVRGGLGHVNVLGSMIFAGMSGSAIADAAGLGQIEIKAMLEAGYDREYSVAVTGASSTIGPIIPPSIPMVLYGVLAQTSVAGLFIGGIIPGILMGLAMMVMCSYFAVKRGYPQHRRATLRQAWEATLTTFPSLLTPVLIIGGIWTGIFTPTEASAVAAAYAVILTVFCYRELTWKGLYRVCQETVLETGIILFILAAASMFGWLLIRYRIPFVLVDFMAGISTNPQVVLVILNIFLLIVGCFMSVAAAITILTPLLVPMVVKVGIDPLHFGVVMVFNLMIGVLTPPYGSVLFVLVRVGNISFDRLVRALVPWYIPLLATLAVISYFPSTVMWLPRLVIR